MKRIFVLSNGERIETEIEDQYFERVREMVGSETNITVKTKKGYALINMVDVSAILY